MKLVIVSATGIEIASLQEYLQRISSENKNVTSFVFEHLQIDILTTGIGMISTAFWMGKTLAEKQYDFAIHFGLAGSYDRTLPLGSVVNVVNDRFSELGVEDHHIFTPFHKLNIFEKTDYLHDKEILKNNFIKQYSSIDVLPQVSGITVNTVHGNEHSINKVMEMFHPTTESMEGAAFMYACGVNQIPYAQIRAISNYVEKRNKQAWKIPLAIKNLNTKAIEIIEEIANS